MNLNHVWVEWQWVTTAICVTYVQCVYMLLYTCRACVCHMEIQSVCEAGSCAVFPQQGVLCNHLWLALQRLQDDNSCLIIQHLAHRTIQCKPYSGVPVMWDSTLRLFSLHERMSKCVNMIVFTCTLVWSGFWSILVLFCACKQLISVLRNLNIQYW